MHQQINSEKSRLLYLYNMCTYTNITAYHYRIHRIHKSSLPLLQFCLRSKTKLASRITLPGTWPLHISFHCQSPNAGPCKYQEKVKAGHISNCFCTTSKWRKYCDAHERSRFTEQSFFDMFSESSQKGEQQRATKQATNSGALKAVGIFFLFKQCFR